MIECHRGAHPYLRGLPTSVGMSFGHMPTEVRKPRRKKEAQ
jgi:hypothetical protein